MCVVCGGGGWFFVVCCAAVGCLPVLEMVMVACSLNVRMVAAITSGNYQCSSGESKTSVQENTCLLMVLPIEFRLERLMIVTPRLG